MHFAGVSGDFLHWLVGCVPAHLTLAEGMVAVFLRVSVSSAPFALHYLHFDLRWFEFYDGVH